MVCWSRKAAISLKRVHRPMEEKLLWGTYRNSPTLFPTAPSPTPPKTPIAIISGTGKATNFKFAQNNNRIHQNKSRRKILEKRECGRIQGLSIFREPPIISRTGKATNFKFCMHGYRLNRNRGPLKISGKVAVGV